MTKAATRKAQVLAIIASAGSAGATTADVCNVLFRSPPAQRTRNAISNDISRLCIEGAVRLLGYEGRAGRFAANVTVQAPADGDPWPAIRATLEAAGAEGLRVAEIADRVGLRSEDVGKLVRMARNRGEVETCEARLVPGAREARIAWRLAGRRPARAALVERQHRVVPEARTPDELRAHWHTLRQRGFAVAPIEGGRVLVGTMELDVPDAVALARGEVSVVEVMGL
jgi:hypothetical protein